MRIYRQRTVPWIRFVRSTNHLYYPGSAEAAPLRDSTDSSSLSLATASRGLNSFCAMITTADEGFTDDELVAYVRNVVPKARRHLTSIKEREGRL